MRRMLLVAMLAVAVLAAPAYASVQNIKVSGDIDSTFLVRDKFDLGQGSDTNDDPDSYQNLLITQTRLRVDADLTDNVSAVVALINERVWGEEGDDTDDTDVDLNLAYVTLREMLYSPLTVVIGRQNFRYGASFVVDSEGANNVTTSSNGLTGIAPDLTKRTAQDAIRLIFDYNPLTIELLASKIDANNNNDTFSLDDDVDLFGIYSTYQIGDDWDSSVESYFFAKIDQSTKTGAGASTTGLKSDSVYMPGLRVSSNPIKGLNVQGEVAWQSGNKATTSSSGAVRADNIGRQAMAAQVITNYMLPFEKTAEYSPVVTGVYTYTSGDSNPTEAQTAGGDNGDTYTAWDPMFESQGGGTIYNSLFDLTNVHIAHIKGAVNPMEDLTVSAAWTGIWLDKSIDDGTGTNCTARDASCLLLRQPGSAASPAAIFPEVTSNKDVGYEVDFEFLYDYTEDVQIGFDMGWFFPGNMFLDSASTAKQFLANVNVNF